MVRSRSWLLLVLILVLAIGLGSLWRQRDVSHESARRLPEAAVAEVAKEDDSFGPIPKVEPPDDAIRPAMPPVPYKPENTSEAMSNLAARMSRQTGGLEVITHADGRRSVDLRGRFMHMSTAVTGPDGKTEVRCFSSDPEMNAALPGNPSLDAPQVLPHVR